METNPLEDVLYEWTRDNNELNNWFNKTDFDFWIAVHFMIEPFEIDLPEDFNFGV